MGISVHLAARTTTCVHQPTTIKASFHHTLLPRLHSIQRTRITATRLSLHDGECTIIAPSQGRTHDAEWPDTCVHFIGGAFAGATPTTFYESFINQLADKHGCIVVVTPYKVTFKHEECARRLHLHFELSLERLREEKGYVPRYVVGVGHSNGALMHAMIGSLCQPKNTGNILIAFNNRQVREAVPVPLESLQGAVLGVQGAVVGVQGASEQSLESAADGAVQRVLEYLNISTRRYDVQENVQGLTQLGSIADELADGYVDFVPSPEDNAESIASSYSVPRTLIVQFTDDNIDQSNELFRMLKRKQARSVSLLRVEGNHVTPLGGGPWSGSKQGVSAAAPTAVDALSPADAISLASVAFSQRQLNFMSQKVGEYVQRLTTVRERRW